MLTEQEIPIPPSPPAIKKLENSQELKKSKGDGKI